MKNTSILDKIITYISGCKVRNVIGIATIFVLLSSVPIVYLLSYLFNQEYSQFVVFISIFLPLVLTPATVYIVIRFSQQLNYYRNNFEDEIEKSKKKDLLMFEQARFVLMGEMMANISHQWRQPLNNIGLSIVSSRMTHDTEQLNKNFDIIEDNIVYLSNTINDFMSFFENKTATDSKPIGEIINEVQSIMRAQIESKGIILNINIDNKIKDIKMTTVISQVLLNLLNNAKDAIDESVVEHQIILLFKTLKDGFEISCCDNGLGIDDEVAKKIFDPYFTTKEKKQGTGIGLYMSKQIVSKIFDGTIELDPSSKNTCFRIKIPCSKNCQFKEVFSELDNDT